MVKNMYNNLTKTIYKKCNIDAKGKVISRKEGVYIYKNL